MYPCGSGGNAEKALGIRIRETFETQGSVLGNFVLKVHGLLNTKTGEHLAGTSRSFPDATPRQSAGLGTSDPPFGAPCHWCSFAPGAGALVYRGSLRKYLVGTGKARSAAAARAKLKLGPIINYNRCAAQTLIWTLL